MPVPNNQGDEKYQNSKNDYVDDGAHTSLVIVLINQRPLISSRFYLRENAKKLYKKSSKRKRCGRRYREMKDRGAKSPGTSTAG